jgi:hypothetical protein
MAINSAIPGLEVEIYVDGKRAREYTNPTETSPKSNEISKYIESIPGTEFSIVVQVQSPFEIESKALVAKIEVDRIPMLRPIFRQDRYEEKEFLLSKTIYGVLQNSEIRNFKFVEIADSELASLHQLLLLSC